MENLKCLLTSTPLQMIFLSSWLKKHNVTAKNVFDHKKYGWIDSLGKGAYIRKGVKPNLVAAVSAIQKQTTYKLHFGGLYALDEFHGIRHYLRNEIKAQVFTNETKPLPSWFFNTFKDSYDFISTSFLPDDIGLEKRDVNGLEVQISTIERSLLEMLYSKNVSTVEAFQIMELVTVLRPNLMTELLESCKSVKVKRLFLYLAVETGYAWYDKIDKSKINLGTGIREIDKGGSFVKEFNVVVNKVYAE